MPAKKTAKTQPQLKWLPDKSFELTLTLPWSKVQKTYQQLLKKTASQITLKGFRKGKAPLDLVEKSIDTNRLYQQVIQQLLPQAFAEAVKKLKLKPAVSPKIEVVSLEKGKDWVFKAISCELPTVSLGDYKKLVRSALAPAKIWTPGKDGDEEKPKQSQSQKLSLIFKALLENIKLTLPQILVEESLNQRLARLLADLEKLGLTLDQYLASVGKTHQQLRANYQKEVENTLKLDLILQAIADDCQITVSDKELEKVIAASPDAQSKKAFSQPSQKAYLKTLIRKQKAIDYLLSL